MIAIFCENLYFSEVDVYKLSEVPQNIQKIEKEAPGLRYLTERNRGMSTVHHNIIIFPGRCPFWVMQLLKFQEKSMFEVMEEIR